MPDASLVTMSDGLVTIRPPAPSDIPLIIAARDDEHRRWLGPGSDYPDPIACIVVERETVGWVDHDHDQKHDWLDTDEVNLGYFVFPGHRDMGFATRAVDLLVAHLAAATAVRTASVLIDPHNTRSLAVARRCGFGLVGVLKGGQLYFRRSLQ
jgi:RimJ/RimL family protein N-acetyltransferase